MTAIFISHRSSDSAEAQELKDWLGQQGYERFFLDFDPEMGIPGGVDWEERLYQELRRCQALLIVLTPAWLESKWCGSEFAIAREKGKAIFVVRVKPCPAGFVIPAIQEVDFTLDQAAGLDKLARGLKEHGLDPRDAFDWKPGRPIYPGLTAFDVDDAAIFFGRSEESWQVVEALRRMRLQATGSPKLLLITGASGSGKSSLMRAGVLARLRKEPASWITARPFRRGTDALSALAEALVWAFPPDRRPISLEAITARLTGPDRVGELLTLARELRLTLDRPEATLVLALDQAEELLLPGSGDDVAKLLDLFRATLAVVGNEIVVIATIRSDRLGAWQQHASIKATEEHGELPFEMLPLGPMPMARIGEIVRGPAAYEGLHIDDDLVDAIRADTATPDALPLLAYTLQYLYRHFTDDGHLTLAEYRSFGGLEGSVRSQADAAIPIDRLSEEDRRALQEAFVPGLVRATAQGGFSRSRAVLATLPSRAEPYLRRLIDDARLLTTDSDPQGGVAVEVAHESLLRVWPTLTRWIAEDAESLRRLEAVQRAAGDWAQGGRRDDFLIHRDHRLSDAEMLIAEPRFAARLDGPDRDYLTACRALQNQYEGQRRRRVWFVVGALLVFVVVGALAGLAAMGRQREAMARLMGEAAAVFRTGDVAGALVPLERIAASWSVWQPENTAALASFWGDRLVPLATFIRQAGPLTVIAVNDQPLVTLESGSAYLPQAEGQPVISFEPALDTFVLLDSNTVSVRDRSDFSPIVEVGATGGTDEGEAFQRVAFKDILRAEALGLVVVRTTTVAITNDEDEPEEWQDTLTFLFRTSRRAPEEICLTSDGGRLKPCSVEGNALAHGVAAVSLSIDTDAVLEPVSSPAGSGLAIRYAVRRECDEDEPCGKRRVDLVRLDTGQLIIEHHRAANELKHAENLVLRSAREQARGAFPAIGAEHENWRLIVSDAPASEPADPNQKWGELAASLDFGEIEDLARYAIVGDWWLPANVVRDSSTSIFWVDTITGNSFRTVSACRFEPSRKVQSCKDFGFNAIQAGITSSSDGRFIAQINYCSSDLATLEFVDMLRMEKLAINAPNDFVVDVGFASSQAKLAALTVQNDLWVYSLGERTDPALLRRISLPQYGARTAEDPCEARGTVHFIDDHLMVVVDVDGRLFAVDSETGLIRWVQSDDRNSDELWTNGRISPAPNGRFFAVQDGRSVQLLDSLTGLPLTNRFRPESLLATPPQDTNYLFETVDVADDGTIRIACPSHSNACAGQTFVRDAPATASFARCRRLELLTGRNRSGNRLDPAVLLALADSEGGCEP